MGFLSVDEEDTVGCSAEVGSSNSITSGFMASPPRDGHAVAGAGELRRVRVGFVFKTHLAEKLRGAPGGCRGRDIQHSAGNVNDVLQDGQVCEEIEPLEHHAHRPTLVGRLRRRHFTVLAGIDRFEVIDSPKENGLTVVQPVTSSAM